MDRRGVEGRPEHRSPPEGGAFCNARRKTPVSPHKYPNGRFRQKGRHFQRNWGKRGSSFGVVKFCFCCMIILAPTWSMAPRMPFKTSLVSTSRARTSRLSYQIGIKTLLVSKRCPKNLFLRHCSIIRSRTARQFPTILNQYDRAEEGTEKRKYDFLVSAVRRHLDRQGLHKSFHQA